MPQPKSAAATFTSREVSLFRALVENNQGIIALLDENLHMLFRSASAERITGWTNDEVTQMPEGLLHPDLLSDVKAVYATALDHPGRSIPLQSRLKHKQGHYIWLEGTVTNKLQDPDIRGLIVNLQDVTERKRYEEKIVKLNRLYHFISQINKAIVKATGENELFAEACRVAVDTGNFRMAWIGIVDKEGKNIVPVVHAGEEQDYLAKIKVIPLAETAEGKGPGGQAIRKGAYIVCNDIESAPEMAPWREAALGRDYQSSIGLPIRRSGKVIGIYSLYADKKNFFDTEELTLLEDVATDISFAIDVMEHERRRRDAEAALTKSQRSYHTLAEASPVGVFHTDAAGSTTYVNPRWCAITGMSTEEALGWGWLEAVHPDDRESLAWAWQDATASRTPSRTEYRFMRPDGKIAWVLGQAVPETDAGGEIVGYVGTCTDITEQKMAEQEIAGERNLSDSIINSLPGVFYLYNQDGQFIRWNTNFEKVTGYGPEEIRGMHPLNFFDESEKELLSQKIGNVFVVGEDSVEAGFLLKSGE
jgi:PAS domain S-box-containing protein